MKEFILASASPRRKALLEEIGAAFTVRPADIDEGDKRFHARGNGKETCAFQSPFRV